MVRHLDLFSGIGGFALAAAWTGRIETVAFCEKEPFCQAVLKKHWPAIRTYGDIHDLTADTLRRDGVQQVDLITGGFPCQPFSLAGKRLGKEDDRHLWPQMYRVIRETRPTWVVGENVDGLLNDVVFEESLSDLEGAGYEVRTFSIPACAVNAPHERQRTWIVAYSAECQRRSGSQVAGVLRPLSEDRAECSYAGRPDSQSVTDAYDQRLQGRRQSDQCPRECPVGQSAWEETWLSAAARLCTLDDGLPGRLVRPRGWRNAAIKAAGNAIVPQVVYPILNAICDLSEAY